MPIRGGPPPGYEHEVIIADGRTYHQGTLLSVANGTARIETQSIVRQGPLRIFPMHAQQDGLYEIQGYFRAQENHQIVLDFNSDS